MIAGCGIDIEEPNRFIKHYQPGRNSVSSLIENIFTQKEIKTNISIGNSYCFPLGFSCKESVFKAFGISWTNSPIIWKDVELIFLDSNNISNHEILLSGYAEEFFQYNNCKKIESLLSFNENFVLFQTLLIA